ncbi:sialate O-acetylesterase [Paradesertivirga mongoliensis]|uniref:Sialate O-acetylesterase n=1 Tax=Paradesertivirga mongoliensis TaxID=2100740 RepID=A0ABW4ZP54_9SPHI|nr:sialate O-acetylesterase [Pedobacter mongoliensis]
MKKILTLHLCLFIALFAHAEVKLASIFTDNMVLQQKSQVPIWGWSTAGKNVRVSTSWNGRNYSAKADNSGKWIVRVVTPSAGGPYELSISDGKAVKLKNVLIGEVWICGGQSNMEMPMKGFKGQPILGSNDAILKSRNKQILVYTVPRSSVTELQQNSKPSAWKVAEPESVANFSATAYYFGRLLNEMLDVPVGLINVSYSGSYVEAWMSPENLKAFPEVKVPAKEDPIKAVSRTPTTLFNGMLYPISGYGIKGAIFYQGESNYERPDRYEEMFPAMVKEWRSLWKQGDFPFYYVQIAPYNYAQLPPFNYGGKFNSAYLRDAQRKSLTRIPNSAMAVVLDIGEENQIHPANKEAGGKRLALLALANIYGLNGFGSASPLYKSMSVGGSVATISFENAGNGLTAFGKELNTFEIAGANKTFYPAKATINGSSVSVSSPMVKEPVAVRYAFKDFIVGDLFNTEGLPASSFRTDDW